MMEPVASEIVEVCAVGKAELLGAAGKTRLIAHAGLVPLEGLDWEEHSER